MQNYKENGYLKSLSVGECAFIGVFVVSQWTKTAWTKCLKFNFSQRDTWKLFHQQRIFKSLTTVFFRKFGLFLLGRVVSELKATQNRKNFLIFRKWPFISWNYPAGSCCRSQVILSKCSLNYCIALGSCAICPILKRPYFSSLASPCGGLIG